MEKVTYLTWSDIKRRCVDLSEQIRDQSITFDAIIAIQRGGCVPGVYLSHIMEIPDFFTIGVRTTATENIRSSRLVDPIISSNYSFKNIKGKRILIVDDVVNTGKTINIAKSCLRKFQPASLKTAALVWDGSYSNRFCPVDFHTLYTPDWVVFPWENWGNL